MAKLQLPKDRLQEQSARLSIWVSCYSPGLPSFRPLLAPDQTSIFSCEIDILRLLRHCNHLDPIYPILYPSRSTKSSILPWAQVVEKMRRHRHPVVRILSFGPGCLHFHWQSARDQRDLQGPSRPLRYEVTVQDQLTERDGQGKAKFRHKYINRQTCGIGYDTENWYLMPVTSTRYLPGSWRGRSIQAKPSPLRQNTTLNPGRARGGRKRQRRMPNMKRRLMSP